MWYAVFINQYGTEFTANEAELQADSQTPTITMLEYIAYCTKRNSILISLEYKEQ